jgi:hypothetical protein
MKPSSTILFLPNRNAFSLLSLSLRCILDAFFPNVVLNALVMTFNALDPKRASGFFGGCF